ncbi:hypothetical protein F5H01DRAFT_326372 [Linnemannia elongata]|nr:hypothetical protein F5H01DRAFT_326372 [Linnemannia elongata]
MGMTATPKADRDAGAKDSPISSTLHDMQQPVNKLKRQDKIEDHLVTEMTNSHGADNTVRPVQRRTRSDDDSSSIDTDSLNSSKSPSSRPQSPGEHGQQRSDTVGEGENGNEEEGGERLGPGDDASQVRPHTCPRTMTEDGWRVIQQDPQQRIQVPPQQQAQRMQHEVERQLQQRPQVPQVQEMATVLRGVKLRPMATTQPQQNLQTISRPQQLQQRQNQQQHRPCFFNKREAEEHQLKQEQQYRNTQRQKLEQDQQQLQRAQERTVIRKERASLQARLRELQEREKELQDRENELDQLDREDRLKESEQRIQQTREQLQWTLDCLRRVEQERRRLENERDRLEQERTSLESARKQLILPQKRV